MGKLFKKLNIFMVLTAVVVLSLAVRMNGIIDYIKDDKPLSVFASASAVEQTPEELPPGQTPEAEDIIREIQQNQAVVSGQDDLTDENRIQEDRNLPDFPVVTFSETEIEVLQSLSKRRKALEEREQRLMQREALLNAAEQEVDRKIAELGVLRGEIEGLLGQQEKVQEERLRSMVKIYESMKPSQAAEIFNTLDMDILLPVLSRMSERKSAPIFASMNPERARQVTMRLVEQSQLPTLDMPAE